MKHIAIIAAVAFGLALSFCLGAATTKPAPTGQAKKFPYASDKLNEEVTMTRLEALCLESTRLPDKLDFEKLHFRIEAYKVSALAEAILVQVQAQPDQHIAKEQKENAISSSLEALCNSFPWRSQIVERHFATVKMPIIIEIWVNDKLVARKEPKGPTKTIFANP